MTSLKDIFEPGDHGSTFGGNYISTSAGLAVLEVLQTEQSSGALEQRIALFHTHLARLVEAYPQLFKKYVGIGLMLGLRATSSEIQQRVFDAAFSQQLIVLKAGRNTVRFLPPLTITEEEINEGFHRFEKAISTL
jgi:acetylornithine aminotransferase